MDSPLGRNALRFNLASALMVAGALSVAACGRGGDSQSQPSLAFDDVRDLTGLSAPTETGTAQQGRQEEIFARSDSLIVSTMHVEIVLPDAMRSFRRLSECSGPQCELLDPVTGEAATVGLGTSEIALGVAETIGSKHGVTLMSESAHYMDVDATSFGAWMEHGSFAVQTEQVMLDEGGTSALYALALGDLTGGPLTGGATWLGIMVGTPTAGHDQGDRLVGTAALNYHFPEEVSPDGSGPLLDVAFSGIKNIDRGMAHSTDTVIFGNLVVDSEGVFATGQSGTRIQGGFYGPGHIEAAGVFEQSDILGAFGAKRQ